METVQKEKERERKRGRGRGRAREGKRMHEKGKEWIMWIGMLFEK